MQAVILAAGAGTRLKHLTSEIPKAMVAVAGAPLIDHVLRFVSALRPTETIVVGGYQAEALEAHVGGRPGIRLVRNREFSLGSVLTLQKAVPLLRGDFLLMNADHIYPDPMAEAILASARSDRITAMIDKDRDLQGDDMKVLLDDANRVRAISKALVEHTAGYIGMTHVGGRRLGGYLRALEAVAAETNGQANVEAVLGRLCVAEPLDTLDLSGHGWFEIDTPEERDRAEAGLAARAGGHEGQGGQ